MTDWEDDRTYVYESKNDDPNGCPDTVIGECEAVCARCQRDMHDELERVRQVEQRVNGLLAACDENERHVRANVPHLPPDGGSFSVHVIRLHLTGELQRREAVMQELVEESDALGLYERTDGPPPRIRGSQERFLGAEEAP